VFGLQWLTPPESTPSWSGVGTTGVVWSPVPFRPRARWRFGRCDEGKKAGRGWNLAEKAVPLRSLKSEAMSRVCQITGKKVMVGNNVSHSNRKTKRRFYPNLQKKQFFVEEDGSFITLRVSAAAMRTIDKLGVKAAIAKAKEKGIYIEK
jgi:large subunit ribosomal protein L28